MSRLVAFVLFLMTFCVNLTLIAQREIAVLRTDEVASLKQVIQTNDLSLDNTALKKGDEQTFALQFDRNQLFLRAAVEGKSGFFLLDTGAPTLLLAKPATTALDNTVEGQGVGGAVNLVPHTVSSFWLGTEEQGKQSAYLIDIDHFSRRCQRSILGMIGYEQLKDFELLVDVKGEELKFIHPRTNQLHELYTPKYSFSFSYDEHLPMLTFNNGKETLRFAIDTGAGSNLINVGQSGRLPSNCKQLIGKVNLAGLDGSKQTLDYVQLPDLMLGELVAGDTRFLPVDLSHLQAENSPSIDGIIGMDFLKQFLFSINFKDAQLHIWEDNASAAK